MAEEVGMKKMHIYAIQLVFIGLMFGKFFEHSSQTYPSTESYLEKPQEVSAPQGINIGNLQAWVPVVARYVIYIFTVRGSQETCRILYSYYFKREIDYHSVMEENKRSLAMFGGAAAVLMYLRESILTQDFLFLFVAYLVTRYPEMKAEQERPPTINYGVGMACSFFEGYLIHVIPSDGARFVGFQENISIFESQQGVVFPVKRLFIIITKSLYCPPDLKHFNKANRDDLPYLEAVKSLEDVLKDVAGVKNRTYRNSAYKIYRRAGPPVYLAAEFATPLHTLHKVLEKRAIYDNLCDVNKDEMVKDFCEQLKKTIALSPDCRGKCELVHYDDTNPDENLADVLLDKIREIQPNFEDVIVRKKE